MNTGTEHQSLTSTITEYHIIFKVLWYDLHGNQT